MTGCAVGLLPSKLTLEGGHVELPKHAIGSPMTQEDSNSLERKHIASLQMMEKQVDTMEKTSADFRNRLEAKFDKFSDTMHEALQRMKAIEASITKITEQMGRLYEAQ